METKPERDDRELVEKLTDKVEGLEEALLSRDVIGQAKGILMERLHLTPDQAFDQLRETSQKLNRKVRDIAAELAQTGEWPTIVETSGNGNSNGSHPAP